MQQEFSESNLNELKKEKYSFCVVIPSYNNDSTIEDVINRVTKITKDIIVVDDGCTDTTSEILARFQHLNTIKHEVNIGKGKALQSAFNLANVLGYDYAITIDSDGQHFPEDIPLFLEQIEAKPNHLLVGARNLKESGQPGKSSFANKISNFWFQIETGYRLPDTQSGFRLYPLKAIQNVKVKTIHYDYELEILVKSYWKDIKLDSVPIRVYYAPDGERVSHFKPFVDFVRITFLNIRLVIMALFWYRPLFALRSLSPKNIRNTFKTAFNIEGETIAHRCHSLALGILFGILPIWGYQLISAILVAYVLKLNKAIVIIAAQISLPPMIPFIIYLSIKTGELVTGKSAEFSFSRLSGLEVTKHLSIYLIGATIFALIAAILSWIIGFGILTFIKNKKS